MSYRRPHLFSNFWLQWKGRKSSRKPTRNSTRYHKEVQEPETRQGIIAGLIQNSQLFPIEINVPGAISNVTNGVQNFGQTVAEGIYIAGENVVAVSQILINSLGQRFPIINRLPFIGTQNNRLTPQEILVFIPPNKSDDVVVDSIPDPSELFTYP